MKKICLFAWLLLVIISCSTHENRVRIEGRLQVPFESEVSLHLMTTENLVLVDSAMVGSDGQFELELEVGYPELYLLKYLGNQQLYLALKPKDEIFIDIDNALSTPAFHITGSPDCSLIEELLSEQEHVRSQIHEISLEYERSKSEPTNFLQRKSELDSTYDALMEKHKAYSEKLIYGNSESLACIFALYQNFGRSGLPLFDIYEDLDVFNFVDSSLSYLYPNTQAVKALNEEVTRAKEQIAYQDYAAQMLNLGSKLPEFKEVSIAGDSISSAKQHQVLVFGVFAVWDEESKQALQHMNGLAVKYKWKKVQFIGVSLDSSKEQLEEFISNNAIEIPIVSDYKYWDSKYVKQFAVKRVPEFLIIDKDHVIVAKDFHQYELEQKIKELI